MEKLRLYLKSLKISEKIAEDALSKLEVYRDFLTEQNKLFNLTSITDPDEIEEKHFIDSLSALPFVEGDVADIGSGAGFPGAVLKIFLPDNRFTLIDSLNKRVEFLNGLIEKLGLTGICAVHSRAENMSKKVLYDTVVARAVSRLNTLSEYCLPFVKVGGKFIAYKSADCDEEIKEALPAIKKLGGALEREENITLFESDIKRKLVIVRKIADTPLKYPRGQNKPKKQPLR